MLAIYIELRVRDGVVGSKPLGISRDDTRSPIHHLVAEMVGVLRMNSSVLRS